MNRKEFLAISTIALLGAESACAADKPSLYEQLRLGLRVQRPQDLGIIKKVVELTDSGRLPYSIVLGTFQWARNGFFISHPKWNLHHAFCGAQLLGNFLDAFVQTDRRSTAIQSLLFQ